MQIDADTCFRAFASRDRRFDGRFVTAVLTTGIYCRPGCPARTPARRNVRFYTCAAAAEAEGFRPCLRCRPDASPGTPRWHGTSATVTRALKLIDQGVMEEGGVESLAGRLGVSGRWLRRLFAEQLGASPLAVDRTRRIHFARRLLETTPLPVADVAVASGFASARRLHAAIRDTFRRAPRELRARRAGARRGTLELKLPLRPPHDLTGVFEFLGTRAIPGVEHVDGTTYRRTFALDGARGVIEARHTRGERWLELRVPDVPSRALPSLVARASRLFDADADAAAIARELRRDPKLARRVPAAGVRVPGAWDPFEIGVRALLGQQVSVAAARTLAGRLARALGAPLDTADGALTHVFPEPAAVAAARLDGFGLTRARAAALSGFAAAVADGTLDFARFQSLDDAVEALTQLDGIGDWTAQYVAMRGLGEPDAFPAGDLGVRKALATNGRLPSEKETIARAECWRPWRAYAVIALWTGPEEPERKERS